MFQARTSFSVGTSKPELGSGHAPAMTWSYDRRRKTVTSGGKADAAAGEKLLRELERQSCRSMFTPDGLLSEAAIAASTELQNVSGYNQAALVFRIKQTRKYRILV